MTLDQYIGQSHLVNSNGPIAKLIKNKHLTSLVFYGPPGIGKTTLANIIAQEFDCSVFNKNAATIKFDELRDIAKTTEFGEITILILDEIHRLDKRGQNFLLPYLEANKLYIIGTTTENPFYALNAALRSRLLLFNLKAVNSQELTDGLSKINHLHHPHKIIDTSIFDTIHTITNGDVRMSINIMNFLLKNYELNEISSNLIRQLFVPGFVYDKRESNHYDLLSAFQKSIRGGDVDAAMHYLARLLNSGDHISLLRRLQVIAYEDIGLANPQAVDRTINAILSFERIGLPEGRMALAFSVCELCLSPKSTSSYIALNQAIDDINKYTLDSIPSNIIDNQPHKTPYNRDEVAVSDNLPKNLKGRSYFKSNESSNYERALNQNYVKRKRLVYENNRLHRK